MDRLGPFNERCALHPIKAHAAAFALGNVQSDQRPATAILGVREAAEVASATEIAVAELISCAAHLPRLIFCHANLPRTGDVVRESTTKTVAGSTEPERAKNH
jgi:hypothetical protein